MLTAEGRAIEYEPPIRKIFRSSDGRFVLMAAGDASLQAEMMGELDAKWLIPRLRAKTAYAISELAEQYRQCFVTLKRRRAEAQVLGPLGLTSNDFIERQTRLAPDIASQLTTTIVNYPMPGFAAIIAGVDEMGSHLWVVSGDEKACFNTVGFAAIGIGDTHADSQLMLAKYSRLTEAPEALLLTYIAKRRSEIAPGVGTETDMFIVGPSIGASLEIPQSTIKELRDVYQTLVRSEQRAFDEALKNIRPVLLASVLQPTAAASSPATAPQRAPE